MAVIENRAGKRGTRSGVHIRIDNPSVKQLFEDLNKLSEKAPDITMKALGAIGLEIINAAQDKIKKDRHIITGRLRNSITMQFRVSRFALLNRYRDKQKMRYSDNDGNVYDGRLRVPLEKTEVAVGTNVNYAIDIEKKDSFLNHAINTAKTQRVDEIIKNAAKEIEREASK